MQNKHGGARPGAGKRKKPVEKKITTTVKITEAVKEACQKNHGSLPKALIFASKNKPD